MTKRPRKLNNSFDVLASISAKFSAALMLVLLNSFFRMARAATPCNAADAIEPHALP